MKYNIFIVSSPLQIMNAIEALEYFKTQNNILLVLYTGNKKQLNQMKKILSFSDWYSITYILLPLKIIDKIMFFKEVNSALKTVENCMIDKVFVGEYRSNHVNHIVNTLTNKDVYLLDDGLAQLSYHQEMSVHSYKVKVRRLIYKILLYKLQDIKYIFFTIFDIKNEQVIKNNYNFFKKNISAKKLENSVYFIGQPLVELGIMTKENHKSELAKIITFYKEKNFIYILHRREEIQNIKNLSLLLNFEYKVFDNLIELEIINANTIPSDFATFFSTAIVTLPHFIKESTYRVFRSQDKYIHKNFLASIKASYKEFDSTGLKVEKL